MCLGKGEERLEGINSDHKDTEFSLSNQASKRQIAAQSVALRIKNEVILPASNFRGCKCFAFLGEIGLTFCVLIDCFCEDNEQLG